MFSWISISFVLEIIVSSIPSITCYKRIFALWLLLIFVFQHQNLFLFIFLWAFPLCLTITCYKLIDLASKIPTLSIVLSYRLIYLLGLSSRFSTFTNFRVWHPRAISTLLFFIRHQSSIKVESFPTLNFKSYFHIQPVNFYGPDPFDWRFWFQFIVADWFFVNIRSIILSPIFFWLTLWCKLDYFIFIYPLIVYRVFYVIGKHYDWCFASIFLFYQRCP